MPRNVRVVTGPAYAAQDRAQAMADALTARALRSRNPEQGGRVAVAMSPWEGVTQLGEAFNARVASNYAERLARAQAERQQGANEQMIRDLAGEKPPERLTEQGQPIPGSFRPPQDLDTGRPMLISSRAQRLAAAIGGMDPAQANQVLSGAVLNTALAGPKYERVDAGDKIIVLQDGVQVGEIPKGATPDASLREQGANARHVTPSGSTIYSGEVSMRGQNLSAETARRGQDMSAETARRGQDLAVTRAGSVAGTGIGLNDRQQSGVNMQRDAAITYAANITGLPRPQIEAILATEGPDAIAKLINERGDRFLQGGLARGIQGIPILGKTIIEATNADLIAPAKSGGAGIALYQNPTGPITNTDFQAGEAQFPNPVYPKEVQADMVRQMLSQGGGAAQPKIPTFATEQEAAAAGIAPGTRVIVGGKLGTWQ